MEDIYMDKLYMVILLLIIIPILICIKYARKVKSDVADSITRCLFFVTITIISNIVFAFSQYQLVAYFMESVYLFFFDLVLIYILQYSQQYTRVFHEVSAFRIGCFIVAYLDNFENQDEKNFSRNGLGLAISYNMAKLLNGTLKVENTPDGWVMFTLTLPVVELTTGVVETKRLTAEYIPKIDTQSILKLPQYEFDKMRPTLLVVDDEIEMLWFIGEIFSADFNVVTLQDPERLDQVMNEVYPNVIICDVMMPGMGGIELTRRIKSVKETAHIPIIVVSGRHEMEQQMEALSAGAEMYITKPFSAEYLRISVCQVIERKEVLKNYFSSPISSFEKSDGKLTHKESKKFLQSVLKIINDNITNKDLTPRYIADRLAISPRSLYRKMEEIGEDSPTDLIKECRLHIAKDLLLTTKKTIDEIVFDSGFSNKVTFFKVFREKYECTPKEFRMKHLEEVQQ